VTETQSGPAMTLSELTERRPRGRPPRFNSRRAELLDVAARIFCERGYQNATLEDIADAMNITRPALYHYGMGKEAILSECNLIANQQLQAAIAIANREKTGLGEIVSYFRQYIELSHGYMVACFILTDRRYMGLVVGERDRLNQRELGHAVQAMVERGVADGSIRPCEPSDVSRTLYGAFNGTLAPFRPGAEVDLEAMADAILRIFIEGLRPRRGE
jgi:TetR/AcrR family transcriptional regulator, cholesterol catabolism regulator